MQIIDIGMGFGDAEEKSRIEQSPLSAGVHSLQVQEVEIADKEKDGVMKKQLVVKFAVVNSSNPDDKGKSVYYYAQIPQPGQPTKWISGLVNLCKALSMAWSGTGLDVDAFIGRSCSALVEHRTFQGRTSAQIKNFL